MNKKDRDYFKAVCRKTGMLFVNGGKHKKIIHKSGAIITIAGTASCHFYKSHAIKDIKRLLLEKGEHENLAILETIKIK